MKSLVLHFEYETGGQTHYSLLQLLTTWLIRITFKFCLRAKDQRLKTGKKTQVKAFPEVLACFLPCVTGQVIATF